MQGICKETRRADTNLHEGLFKVFRKLRTQAFVGIIQSQISPSLTVNSPSLSRGWTRRGAAGASSCTGTLSLREDAPLNTLQT